MSSKLGRGIRSYAPTLVTECLVVTGTLFAFWYIARTLGPSGFAEYQVARAALTTVEPLLILGLLVSLPRLVARSVAERGGAGRDYLLAAIRATSVVMLVLVPLVAVLREPLAFAVFGDAGRGYEILALLVPAVGLVVEGVAYGYLRGRHHDIAANALRLGASFVAPVFAVAVSPTVFWILVVYGSVILVSSVVALVWAWPWQREPRSPCTWRLLSDSIPRVPGDVASAWLLTVPTLLTTHLVGLVEAGFVGFGTSVVALVVAPVGPMSFVLVPHLSREIGAGRGAGAYRSIRLLPVACGLFALGFVAVLWVVMDLIVQVYLGAEFVAADETARLISVSAVPLAVFLGARGIIDAFYDTARNSRNLGVALILQLAVTTVSTHFLDGREAVALGLFIACSALAVLTLRSLAGIGLHQPHPAPIPTTRPV